jgi:putative ABC transport system permease protein
MPNWKRAIDDRLAGLEIDAARRLEIVEELSQHLDDRYEDLRAAWASDEVASRDAMAQLKRVTRQLAGVERRVPDVAVSYQPGGRAVMASIWQDAQYAVRTFAKNKGFALVVTLTLALGIGATTAIFSVVDGVMLRPLPYPDIERILAVSERTTSGRGMSISWPNFEDWRDQNQVFEHLGIYRGTTVTLTGGDQPERLNAAHASSEVFGAMGVAPASGRVFTSSEDRPGGDRVAIVSDRLWRNRFGADPGMLGRRLLLNGEPYVVIGVMPPAMRFPSRLTDVWLPFGLIVPTFPPRGAHPGLNAMGKLKPGVTFDGAVAEMDTVARRLEQQYPGSNKNNRVALTPYYEQVVRNIRPALIVLLTAVGVVLLIGCANLANLMLSKAEGRHREIAIRAALGADRRRIVQQLLIESLLLAGAGGTIGALLASWAVKAFVASQPSTVPRIDLLAVDGRVLVFTAAISIATGILFGLAPAWRASAPDLLTALKESARSATAASRRFRSSLVVAEIALALVLLVGAGLAIRSFGRLMAIDPGFNPERVVTVRVNLPQAKYPDNTKWTAFHRELLRRVSAMSGIESAGLNSAVPLEGGGSEAPVIKEGDAMPNADHPAPTTLFQTTSPDYFRAMGIPLLKGRPFTDRDTADAPLVAIVDETLVRAVFHDADPIGKRISFEIRSHTPADAHPIWREVVGVVRHVRHYGLAGEPPFVQVYTPFEQLPVYMQPRGPSMALFTRTTLPPDGLAAALRRELAAIDPDIPLYGLQTMGRYLEQNTEQPRLNVVLLGGFGALALVLAIVGIYSVLSYTVSQRTQEIGIRMALGASRRDVLALVVGQGMLLAGLGVAIGLAASYAVARSMRALLFEISPHDPATFATLTTLLAVVALAASAVPGLRATRVDPIEALRRE